MHRIMRLPLPAGPSFMRQVRSDSDWYARRSPSPQTRSICKSDMVLNSATPHIEVDSETYEVRADGVLLTCEPAEVLPLAQRYFLY